MPNKRFLLAILCILLFVAFGLPGCSGDQGHLQLKEKPQRLTLQIMAESFGAIPDMNNVYYQELQRRLNVNLNMKWVLQEDYNAQFDLVLSSGNLPEIIVRDNPNHPALVKAIQKGVFWDLTPFLGDFSEYPNLKLNTTPGIFDEIKFQGKIYAIPRSRPWVDRGLKIRKDWLDRLGIPIPATLDDYTHALKQIIEGDPDNNGIKDTLGIVDSPFTGSFKTAFGLHIPYYDEAGGLIHELLTPQAIELIRWYRGLYEQGILSAQFGLIRGPYAQDLLQRGRLASYEYNIYYDYKWEQELRQVQPDARLITLPPLQGPRGTTAHLQKGFTGAFYISSKVPEEKVKEILSYFDRSAEPSTTGFAYYGLPGVHHVWMEGEPILTELGKQQLSITTLQPLASTFEPWAKVHNWAAPKAYNDTKKEEVRLYSRMGVQNPFDWLVSMTWSEVWPSYKEEFDKAVISAITGALSMEAFELYVKRLRNEPEIRKAFQEFAKSLLDAPPRNGWKG